MTCMDFKTIPFLAAEQWIIHWSRSQQKKTDHLNEKEGKKPTTHLIVTHFPFMMEVVENFSSLHKISTHHFWATTTPMHVCAAIPFWWLRGWISRYPYLFCAIAFALLWNNAPKIYYSTKKWWYFRCHEKKKIERKSNPEDGKLPARSSCRVMFHKLHCFGQ